MDCIVLENISIYAYHGCLEEESKIGSEYLLDLKVWGDFSKSALSDNLEDTVDYVLLCKIVKKEMHIRSKLLENVGKRILKSISDTLPKVKKAEIRISKINPPIGGHVEKVSIVMQQCFEI